jgi:exodeoxyribonuclease VIII
MIDPGLHSDLSFPDYLAIERLSPSGAKLMARSPAHYRHNRTHPAPETPALKVGKAVHALALEGKEAFAAAFSVAPECDRRTKEGKALWADFTAASEGRTVLTATEAELVEGMAGAILAHPLAPALLADGTPELSMIWTDPETGAPCKGRADLARLADGCLLDLKTTVDASPAAFARAVLNYGYATQAAAYLSGASALGADVTDFVIIAVEKSPPFAVGIYRMPAAALALGRRRWGEACALYAACLESGRWPGYPETITELTLPAWATNELFTDETPNETE